METTYSRNPLRAIPCISYCVPLSCTLLKICPRQLRKDRSMRYVSVRVVNSSGQPSHGTRVALDVHQAFASGMKAEYTNSEGGLAEFTLDVDDGAEITVYAEGNEKVKRGSIRSSYTVTV